MNEKSKALPHAAKRSYSQGTARIATEDDGVEGRCVVMVGARQILECYADGEVQDAEDEANALRVVACWKACDGISTDEVARMAEHGHFARLAALEQKRETLIAQVLLLKMQRDELIELLQLAIQRKPMLAATYHAIVGWLTDFHGNKKKVKP
jgi:hypothetical protein